MFIILLVLENSTRRVALQRETYQIQQRDEEGRDNSFKMLSLGLSAGKATTNVTRRAD